MYIVDLSSDDYLLFRYQFMNFHYESEEYDINLLTKQDPYAKLASQFHQCVIHKNLEALNNGIILQLTDETFNPFSAVFENFIEIDLRTSDIQSKPTIFIWFSIEGNDCCYNSVDGWDEDFDDEPDGLKFSLKTMKVIICDCIEFELQNLFEHKDFN